MHIFSGCACMAIIPGACYANAKHTCDVDSQSVPRMMSPTPHQNKGTRIKHARHERCCELGASGWRLQGNVSTRRLAGCLARRRIQLCSYNVRPTLRIVQSLPGLNFDDSDIGSQPIRISFAQLGSISAFIAHLLRERIRANHMRHSMQELHISMLVARTLSQRDALRTALENSLVG